MLNPPKGNRKRIRSPSADTIKGSKNERRGTCDNLTSAVATPTYRSRNQSVPGPGRGTKNVRPTGVAAVAAAAAAAAGFPPKIPEPPTAVTPFGGVLLSVGELFLGENPSDAFSRQAPISPDSFFSALSQTPRTPEYRNPRKTNRTISFKEYIEAELNSKPVFSTNQGKSKEPGFENGSKEIKSSSASTEGTRTNSSPRYSFTSPDYDGFYQVYSHEAPGPQRMGQPYTAAPPTPSYHPYRR